MNIVVCLKSCRRTDTPLRLNAAGLPGEDGGAALQPTTHELAPLLAALALRAQIPRARAEIMAISAGPPAWDSLLRHALAIGADEVLRVWGRGWHSVVGSGGAGEGSARATRAKAAAVAEAIAGLEPALVLAGERSRDTGNEAFGAMLAHRLGLPFAHRAVELTPMDEGWGVRVKLERGYTQDIAVGRPAVVTLAEQIAEVPYSALPEWMAAQSARIPQLTAAAPPAAAKIHHTTLRPPLPRVKRYSLPEDGLDAEGRIEAMVALPATQAGTILPAGLGADAQAREAAQFLAGRGYI